MELQRASGRGWVLFGFKSENQNDWFERWFETAKKAKAHAARKGWKVRVLK